MDRRGYILELGSLDYQKAWDFQRRLWLKRADGEAPDMVLILEHPHVITLGRRGDRSSLLISSKELEAMKIPLFQVERGGDVTYHGPGQIVVYPILNLKDYGYRLIRYVGQLEEIVLAVLKDFGIEGRRDSSNRGVWAGKDKIASVGVAIRRWTSMHGFALNYATDLKYFELIHPCGLQGVKITSMEKLLGKKVSKDQLTERLCFHFKEIFQRDWERKEIEEILNSKHDI